MLNLLKKHNYTEILFYVFVFLLPLQTRWIFVESSVPFQQMSLYGFDIVLVVLFGLRIFNDRFSILKKIQNSKFDVHSPRHVLLVACYLLLATSLLSVLWSPNPDLTLYWSIRLLLGVGLLSLVRDIEFSFRKLAIILTTAITIQAILGIGQFIFQDILIVTKWLGATMHDASVLGTSVIETHGGRWLRAYGTQPHPNILGGLMVVGIILAHHLISTLKPGKRYEFFIIKRAILVTCFLLLVVGLLFSFSRSAWVALSIVAIVYFLKQLKSPLKPVKLSQLIILPAMTVIFMFTAIYAPVFQTRFDTSARLEQRSVQERATGLALAKDIIGKRPVTGNAHGAYTPTLQKNNPSLKPYEVNPVHNIYLLILAELGITGFALFAVIIVMTWRASRHISQKQPFRVTTENQAILSVFVAFAILGMFDHYLWTSPSMFFVAWLIISTIQHLPSKE